MFDLSDKKIILLVIGSVVLGVVGVLFGIYHWNSRGHWYEQSQEFREEAQRARDSTQVWKERTQEADSASQAAKDSTEATRERAEERIEAAREVIEVQETQIQELEGDPDVQEVIENNPKVRELIDAKDGIIAQQSKTISEQQGVIESQDHYIGQLENEVQTQDSLIISLENELVVAVEQKEEWREEAKPSMFEFSLGSLPKDVLLLLAGRASAEVF